MTQLSKFIFQASSVVVEPTTGEQFQAFQVGVDGVEAVWLDGGLVHAKRGAETLVTNVVGVGTVRMAVVEQKATEQKGQRK